MCNIPIKEGFCIYVLGWFCSRFLVSFAGKYLAHDYCVASKHGQTEGDTASSFNHQLYKICIPRTEPDLCGPAFVEVGILDNF